MSRMLTKASNTKEIKKINFQYKPSVDMDTYFKRPKKL